MNTRSLFRAALLTAATCLLLATAAQASTATGSVSVASGGLTITTVTSSINFGTVTLNGIDQTVAASTGPSFTIIDGTGSGAGWNVSFSATNFSDGGTNTIANTNFTFNPTGGSITKVGGQNVDATNGPKETGGGAVDMSASRKVVTTAVGYGKGKYTYTPLNSNFSLTVPATTMVASYTSTLTATVASGP